MQYNSDIEQALLRRIAGGDEQAYQVIFDRYADRMYANALHFTKSPELAKDLTQEVFIRVWLHRSRLTEIDRFDGWLFTVARNVIRNELRKKVLSTENIEFLQAYFKDGSLTPEERLEFRELEARVDEAIAHLPPQMKSVFLYSRQEGLTHEQIAQKMNISVVSSKTYMVRCLLAIRRHLGKNGARLGLLLFLLSK